MYVDFLQLNVTFPELDKNPRSFNFTTLYRGLCTSLVMTVLIFTVCYNECLVFAGQSFCISREICALMFCYTIMKNKRICKFWCSFHELI